MSNTLSLVEYFMNDYTKRVSESTSWKSLVRQRRAVEIFDRFAGPDILLSSMTEHLLIEFCNAPALTDTRLTSRKGRTAVANDVRRVLRSWNPGALRRAGGTSYEGRPTVAGSLWTYFEEDFAPVVWLGCSPKSFEEARGALNALYLHHGREVLMSELSARILADHLQWLLKRPSRPATVNKHRGYINQIWNHAYDAGLAPKRPPVKKLQRLLDEPDSWSLQEWARILAAAIRFEPNRDYHGVPRNLWWHGLLLVTWSTALRRGTLFSLRRDDYDRRSGWLHCRPTIMKNKRGKRFRLTEDATAAVDRIWRPARELLFPSIDKSAMYKAFRLILKDAQVAHSARRAPSGLHKVRRTVATHLAASAGISAASKLLGHKSEGITRESYIDPRFVPELEADVTGLLPAIPPIEVLGDA